MNPKVTCIVPTRNRAKLLPRALKSILSQTFKDLEIIIIDDHSNDGTPDAVKNLNDPRIRYYLQKIPKNGAQATNEGIDRARGKYIAFLDDDDEWLPEKLEKQVNKLDLLGDDYGMVYCWMDYYDSTGLLLHQTHPLISGNIFENVLLNESIGGTPTFLVRKSVIDKIGGFDTNLVIGDDGEFVRRVAKEYKIDYVPEVLVNVHVNHGFKRQSEVGKENCMEVVNSLKYIMEKYRTDFDKRPVIKSVAFATLARQYAVCRNYGKFLSYAVRSAKTSLLPIGKYKMMIKSVVKSFR